MEELDSQTSSLPIPPLVPEEKFSIQSPPPDQWGEDTNHTVSSVWAPEG